MKVTGQKDNENHEHYRTVYLSEATPFIIKFGYSHKGKMILPQLARAKYKHGEVITNIELVGSVLKKDGTVGANTAKLQFTTPASEYHGKYNPDSMAPDWLVALFVDAPGQVA